MQKYDYLTDQVTFYFITVTDPTNGEKWIKAFTDNRDLANFYLDFHHCPNLGLRKLTGTLEEIIPIVNSECRNDEIDVYHFQMRARKPGSDLTELVSVPATQQEYTQVQEQAQTFCSSKVNYHDINEVLPRLRGKYQSALATIGLLDVIGNVIRGKHTRFTREIAIDELRILVKFFPVDFG